MSGHKPASSALQRFTVLDLTRVRAGPTCVRQLADWGANVIKVEMPEAVEGDNSLGGPRHKADFQNLHRNKRSITLNLKEAEGVALLKRLVEKADVVVENYRPDVKHRLGIDYETLRKVNPRLVYASISGFGQDGPYRLRAGVDQIAQGMGGLMWITGEPGQGPMRVGIAVADVSSGLLAANGVLTALLEREVSGQGQWVQTSLLQAQIFICDFQAARWTVDRDVAPQAGNNHPTSIPTGVFRTADGYINIAGAGQEIWRRCARALGLEELISHPDYESERARSKNRDTLNGLLAAKTAEKPSAYWIELLAEAGVPCGPINRMDEVFADPQVRHLGMAAKVETPSRGTIEVVAQPIVMSRTPTSMAMPPPERGEHTREVLGELGLTAAELDDLARRNVI